MARDQFEAAHSCPTADVAVTPTVATPGQAQKETGDWSYYQASGCGRAAEYACSWVLGEQGSMGWRTDPTCRKVAERAAPWSSVYVAK
jgi:hypothetical protein